MESNYDDVDLAYQPVGNDNEALASFNLPMFINGDDNNIFHTKNASMSDWNRRICSLLEVLYSTLDDSPKSTSATLLVLKFRFATIKHRRRLVRARISIEFFSKDPEVAAPTVLAIGFDYRWAVEPTVDHDDSVAGGKMNVGVPGIPFVEATVAASTEKTRSRDRQDATTITGSTHFGKGLDTGNHTACSWTLLENKTRKNASPNQETPRANSSTS
ncbi:uncharacterized protein NECHADRAFT_89211 [Fusarium vanettenii 77-13-4]|uniref:Uncharacterized protein n=1 Tax=Fusarium vanettenii (strain ATCC MYA-4622 / CBS 123669 / FGSC 9596 / NRRL 45880 / 77-13-4) TaxID=660122 RepID=C7ZQI5_FUSV7|nr:uncharacterized protein NECHADRAFT_89211 [Fusarium vanettenii 77-13-4]EEU33720.1 hypothetical protein NECHADRAFT_89211 [Fusarium vanettenii 77-13-4]